MIRTMELLAIAAALCIGFAGSTPALSDAAPQAPADRQPQTPEKKRDEALLEAVKKNDLTQVRALLKQGASPAASDAEGVTLLMKAAASSYRGSAGPEEIAVLKELLQHKVDIGARDKRGRTALHHALEQQGSEYGIRMAQSQVVALLLEHGADVNASDNQGVTPLSGYVGAWRADPKIVQLLLSKRPDTSIENKRGETALMIAASAGNRELIPLLLDGGAQINAKNKAGVTALSRAIESGQSETATLLMDKGADPAATPYNSREGVLQATCNHALINAIVREDMNQIKAELDKGADVKFADSTGQTPLMVATTRYTTETIKLLLDKGAEVNVRDKAGNTPMILGAKMRRAEMLKLLLESGAEVNARNLENRSALLNAAEIGDQAGIELLLASGADLNATDNMGKNALLLAVGDQGTPELLQLLLDKGLSVHAVDSEGNSALMIAVQTRNFSGIETLLAAGARVDVKNKKGWTALRYAQEARAKAVTKKYQPHVQEAEYFIKALEKAGAKE